MYNPAELYHCLKHEPKVRRKWANLAITGIGVAAAFSSLPQVIQNYQTHSASGVSVWTYAVSVVTLISWLFYGIYIKNKPLIYTSLLSLIFSLVVLIQIIFY